ncbi:TetR/AcrR family transcriptional regulator [Nicoliella spurrieriana]|uniref:TetR/AcrR family transcriptional regulator n=1 Tax=Nicoliella spurrieriana TaxID=2925830 RepID=A0A976RRB9_9LACO|nr:helix-turn-helix domain-containing protein [Nicoliella spurrieriana]UQS86392.1 TetR/AcrR family transcriptional regulator [Nicoliella spurrieriana]
MGRRKSFNQSEVLNKISMVFVQYGFEGTSLDLLVNATGLLRGSLYAAFGSKLGMFIAALKENINHGKDSFVTTYLMVIAMMELTSNNVEVKQIVLNWYHTQSQVDIELTLGRALLHKSGLLGGIDDGKQS